MAKARAAAVSKEPEPIVEEMHFRSDNAFLCLLLNRRTKAIRVIDFRAGASMGVETDRGESGCSAA